MFSVQKRVLLQFYSATLGVRTPLLRVLLQFYGVLVQLWASKADAGAQIDFGIGFWLILKDLWSIFNGFLIDAAFF